MKKLILIVSILFNFIIQGFSKEANKLNVYPIIGYTYYNSNIINDAYAYGLGVEYFLINDVSIDLSFFTSTPDVDFDIGSTDMRVNTLSFFGDYYLPLIDSLDLKFKIGVVKASGEASLSISSRGNDNYGVYYLETASAETKLNESFKLACGIGLDFGINNESSVSVDFNYVSDLKFNTLYASYKWFFA